MRVAVVVLGEIDDHAAQGVGGRGHVGQLHLDGLARVDGLAEGHAVARPGQRHLQHALAHAEVRVGDVHAGDGQRVHGHFHALAFLAEQVLRLELHVGHFEAGVPRAAAAHHMRHVHQLEALGVHGHEEGAQALVAFLVGIGHGDDIGELGHVGMGDEPLLAVQNVIAIRVLHGGGVHVGSGAAGLLSEREAGEDGLVGELVHVGGLQLVATVVVQDAPVQVGRVVQVHAHAARAPGELLLHLQDLLLGEAPSAVLFGQRVAVQVVLAGQVDELLRELVGDLHLALHFLEGAFRQLAAGLQEVAELLVGQLAHKASS